ncbi:MAG: HAMP domain-containing sensor histidine kinase [Acidobacteriota bacterium]
MSWPTTLHQFLLPPEQALGSDFVEEIRKGALRGLRLACWMAAFTGLIFLVVYRLSMAPIFVRLLPSLLALLVLGIGGIAISHSRVGQARPRGFSVVLAMLMGTFLVVLQQSIGSHLYGHFGGLLIILFVMADLGTLKPIWTLITALYFFVLYFGTGVLLDPDVGWPPSSHFTLPSASLAVAGALSVWLTSLSHRNLRTDFLLREEVKQALRRLQETQAQLLASEKALTQNQLVAALSHELNNPFGAIVSNLSSQRRLNEKAGRALSDPGAGAAELNRLLAVSCQLTESSTTAAHRIQEMLERMREFSHLDAAEKKPVDINNEISKALEMVRAEKGTEISVEAKFGSLPAVVCHPQKLSVALGNIVRNALDAAGKTGMLRVETRHVNGQVEVVIEDNGKGFSESELSALFDPGFVTVDGRVRTNWDLATSRQVLLQHQGQMDIKSTPGKGTRVRVTLPAS